MSTATMTADELHRLSVEINRLRDELTRSPEWCESTPLGLLCEMDDDALAAAAKVVYRLHIERKFPRDRTTSYLPEPTPEPQSLRA